MQIILFLEVYAQKPLHADVRSYIRLLQKLLAKEIESHKELYRTYGLLEMVKNSKRNFETTKNDEIEEKEIEHVEMNKEENENGKMDVSSTNVQQSKLNGKMTVNEYVNNGRDEISEEDSEDDRDER